MRHVFRFTETVVYHGDKDMTEDEADALWDKRKKLRGAELRRFDQDLFADLGLSYGDGDPDDDLALDDISEVK